MDNVKKTFLFFILYSSLLATASITVQAQEPAKIGLVLAGGGAKGLAHIGVIKELEKQNIKIDYIAGTSMGALVGGLYAAGLSSATIENFVNNLDWDASFSDEPERNFLSFRQKKSQFNFFITGEIGMRDWKLQLPSGLIQGQKQDILLEGLLLNVASITDFSKLPIPFTAVATDIATGKPYLLQKGNLAIALRTSMSVPGFFSPVKIDGHLLVDGGITNNTPIDVARNMGADIIIVSDIHSQRAEQKDINNFLDISGEVAHGLTLNNTLQQLNTLTDKDIIIKPDLTGFSSSSFERSEELILLGQKAVLKPDVLQALKHHRQEKSPTVTAPIEKHIISKININNNSGISTEIIKSALKQPLNAPLDQEKLESDLSFLYGQGFFQNLTYQIDPNKPSEKTFNSTLTLNATEPNWGPNFIKTNFSLASNLADQSLFNLGFRHTYKPVNSLGAEWRNEVQIGDERKLSTEFYQPLDNALKYYLKPFAKFLSQSYIYSTPTTGTASVNFSKNQLLSGVEIGVNLNSNNRISSNIFYESGQINMGRQAHNKITNPYHQNILGANFLHDSLDQVSFPSYGKLLDLNINYITPNINDSEWATQQWVKLSMYHSFDRHTFNLYGEYTNTEGSEKVENVQLHTLGGFQRLSGFREDELIGNKISFARLKYQYRVHGNSSDIFNFPFYLGGTLEAGNIYGDISSNTSSNINFAEALKSASIFVGLNTFLGPLYLAYGYHDKEIQSVYFYFGKEFN